MSVSRATIRGGLARLLALLLLAGGAALTGCTGGPIHAAFTAERDLWRARMLERRLQLEAGATPQSYAPAVRAYERILERYRPEQGGSDTSRVNALGRVRASTAQTLARLYFLQGSRSRAVGLLWSEREILRDRLPAVLAIYGDLLQLLSRGATADSLEMIYREVISDLPAGSAAGNPYPLVLEAPARLGEMLKLTGREAEARAAYLEALDRYDAVAAEHPGTALEVAARVQKANVLTRLDRAQEAEQVLTAVIETAAAAPVASGILFSRAALREQALRDPIGAALLYRQVLDRWPQSEAAVQSSLRIGLAFATGGRPDSALTAFDRAERLFPRNLALAAQARYLGAKVLLEMGRQEEGVRRLRSVSADYPRTDVGLMSLLDIASYHEKQGDIVGEQAMLREAEATYLRFWKDMREDPRQRDFLRATLDRLAEARTRLQDWKGTVEALLQRGEAFPGDERSPLALAQAAGISETKLNDRQETLRILQLLVDRYPQHPIAIRAKEKIPELAGSGS